MTSILILSCIIYFTVLALIGIYYSRKNKNVQDYMVGGRSVNYYVTAIATQASDMGSWLFLGFPAAVYLHGVFEYWTAIGLITGMFLAWTFVAPRLRILSGKLNSLTITSFFSQITNDTTGKIDIISSIITIIFFTFYIASGLVSLSLLFEYAFHIPYQSGMIISLLTAALYTLLGGFIAVAWCDFFQGIFLLCMITLVPTYALLTQTSIHDIILIAQEKSVSLTLFKSPQEIFSALALAAGWGLGYFGQPHILVNFMGIDHENNINAARRVGIIWQSIVLTAATAIGLVGIGLFAHTAIDPQLIYIRMTLDLFHPLMAGFVLCAIFSATLSTLDSLMLVSGATIAENIMPHIIGKTASNRYAMIISRIGTILVSCLALGIAWQNTSSVYHLVNYAWAGLGSSFGPLMLFALYTKNISANVATTAMISGAATAALWPYLSTNILPLVPGFFVGITILGINFLYKKYNA